MSHHLSPGRAKLLVATYHNQLWQQQLDGNKRRALAILLSERLVRQLYSGVLVVTKAGEARIANMKTRNKRGQDEQSN